MNHDLVHELALSYCMNKLAKFLSMLFVFLCICSLFLLLFHGPYDGLAKLFRKSGNPEA